MSTARARRPRTSGRFSRIGLTRKGLVRMSLACRGLARMSLPRTGLACMSVSLMGLLVTAVPAMSADAPQYIAWSRATVTAPPGAPDGYLQFQNSCAVCHGAGPEKPGTRALAAKYKGTLPALLEQRTNLTPDFIKYTVRHGVSVMPPFRKTELSDADLNAIAAYLTRKKR
jgi:mono/diheme cytochrome c family protein